MQRNANPGFSDVSVHTIPNTILKFYNSLHCKLDFVMNNACSSYIGLICSINRYMHQRNCQSSDSPSDPGHSHATHHHGDRSPSPYDDSSDLDIDVDSPDPEPGVTDSGSESPVHQDRVKDFQKMPTSQIYSPKYEDSPPE